jgi:hypothetical protein
MKKPLKPWFERIFYLETQQCKLKQCQFLKASRCKKLDKSEKSQLVCISAVKEP